jgi:hypothetical protein
MIGCEVSSVYRLLSEVVICADQLTERGMSARVVPPSLRGHDHTSDWQVVVQHLQTESRTGHGRRWNSSSIKGCNAAEEAETQSEAMMPEI